MAPEPVDTVRLDKWLWRARFFKTRTQAARFVQESAVRLNSARVEKPATAVRVGDGISFAQGGIVRALRILDLGARRGPASEARRLYAELGDVSGLPIAPKGEKPPLAR